MKEIQNQDIKESDALKKESKLKSQWFIMDIEGNLHTFEEFKFKGHEKLKIFSGYEVNKDRTVLAESLHIAAMRKLELADNEPASDSGNLRYYPKGRLIKSLIEQFVTKKVSEYGGAEIETPIMYDMNHPCLASYLNRFPARQYQMTSDDRQFFFRFAACFGDFLMLKDAQISYKHLPFKVYEMTRYSFRREQKGELTGLRRLRAFTMPDCHALCSDFDQAKEEFNVRLKLCLDTQEAFGLGREDFELAVRVTKDFYENNKEFVQGIVKKFGKPALIEMWEERIFYFVLKYEFNFVDSLNKASALSTDQIDVENGKQYGIVYTDSHGEKKNPIILHCSPSGAVERVMYAVLEKQMMRAKIGKPASFPLWLAPTQVRIISIAENNIPYCLKVMEKLRNGNIRVDLDDRDITLNNKIRRAEQEWIPYIIVLGDKEEQDSLFSLRKREEKFSTRISSEILIKEISEQTQGRPFMQLSLPQKLSLRPIFTS